MHITVALSWFHRKVGPIVFYYYPEGELKEDEKIRIADQIDQAFEEGFFSHSFDNLISMNYYFEIYSQWARGQKEMLMISVIFDDNVSSDVEHEVLGQSIDFARRLRENEDIFKAFYNVEDPQYAADIDDIKRYNELIRLWVKELYWSTIEITREKSEEEILAELMNQESVYDLVRFLSHGPVSLEDLEFWFNIKFQKINFREILNRLEKERIIFINDIGVENYVLLVKEIAVERIPPDAVVSLVEDEIEIAELTKLFYEKVQNYFNNYVPTAEDSKILFRLVSDSKIYNVLSQLRTGPIPRDKLTKMISEGQLNELIHNLNLLKDHEIIDEFEYSGETLVILKTDIRFTTQFPEYLKGLIPKETKVQIAKSYQPRRVSTTHIQNIGLEEDVESETFNEELFDIQEGDIFGNSGEGLEDLKRLSKLMDLEPEPDNRDIIKDEDPEEKNDNITKNKSKKSSKRNSNKKSKKKARKGLHKKI